MVSEVTGTTPANPEAVAADRQEGVKVSFFSAVGREREIAVEANPAAVEAIDVGINCVLKSLDQLKATVSFKHSETDHQTSGPFVDDFFAHVNS